MNGWSYGIHGFLRVFGQMGRLDVEKTEKTIESRENFLLLI